MHISIPAVSVVLISGDAEVTCCVGSVVGFSSALEVAVDPENTVVEFVSVEDGMQQLQVPHPGVVSGLPSFQV